MVLAVSPAVASFSGTAAAIGTRSSGGLGIAVRRAESETRLYFRRGIRSSHLHHVDPVVSSRGFSSSEGRSVPTCSASQEVAATAESAVAGEVTQFSELAQAKVLSIVGAGSVSPFNGNSWEDVMRHMAQRIGFIDTNFEMLVLTEEAFLAEGKEFDADVAIVIAVRDVEVAEQLQKRYLQNVPTLVSFDSAPNFVTRLGSLKVKPVDQVEKMLGSFPGSKRKDAMKVLSLVEEAWERKSSDDVRFALLVLIDSYVTPVTLLKNLRATSLASVQCMVKNCRSQILSCILDPNCRQALNCLQSCAPTDQVCSYRCIVSYESEKLEAFTLCVLQKHNCLGLSADILMQPDVQPMKLFRGNPVTHEIAEDLFIGWLGRPNPDSLATPLKYSWRVVAGQNAAYDQFPCQFQIFYRGKAKGSMWYDPVFQVQTLDGKLVWRRRHYRVKRDVVPGTFYFTVLDNGVISKEFWRIVDVKDDLSWGLFYYSGAAAAAGQSYTGAILVTQDGSWPPESEAIRLNSALDKCGIKVWELYRVNNAGCSNPPLSIPEGSSLHSVIT